MAHLEIKCAYTELVPIEDITLNERNRNQHPPEQIERLGQLLEYYGIRHPIILDKNKVCWAGEGRFLAMRAKGMTHVPCDFQDFSSKDQAQQFSIADNEVARWAKPDLAGISTDIVDWGPEFELELLGMEDFKLDISEMGLPNLPDGEKGELEQITFTLHKDQATEVRNAVQKAIDDGPFGDTNNENKNGNALARICEWFLNA